jgi:holo-[acyl-carrier protein] synthase
LLTENELQEVPEEGIKLINYISKRWAAKEAISKSFGTGIGAQLSFQDMEITHLESGAPTVVLSESALQLAQTKNFNSVMITVSDEADYAVAFAVAV